MSSYHAILGVSENASFTEIKKSYKRLASTYHPDRNKAPDASDKFKLVQESYNFLKLLHERKKPIVTNKTITLEEAYTGTVIKIDGLNVKVPPGVRNNKLKVNKSIIQLKVKSHPFFKRAGDDLLVVLKIDAIEALVGTDVRLKHLDGEYVNFKVLPATQHNQVMKLVGKGMPNPVTNKNGDLLIQYEIVVPLLTKPQQNSILHLRPRKLIEE